MGGRLAVTPIHGFHSLSVLSLLPLMFFLTQNLSCVLLFLPRVNDDEVKGRCLYQGDDEKFICEWVRMLTSYSAVGR